MALALALATLAVMCAIAFRARARFKDVDALPMNFAPDGTPLWSAPRDVALWFMPGLAALIFLALLLFAPDGIGVAVSSACLIGGQVFFHWLIGRTI